MADNDQLEEHALDKLQEMLSHVGISIFNDEEVAILRQMITAWKGLTAIGVLGSFLKKFFWFIGLFVAFYMAATGKIAYLITFLANIGGG